MPPRYIPKKERLTLAQLTTYDDILTDALVDHVYFWTHIRKNKRAYHSSRGIREEDVTSILQKSVIIEKDAAKAETQLLALPGLKKFLGSLKTEKEKDDFRKHLRKYISIYLPDCPFEVSTSNRYTIDTHEAAVTTRRLIKKGEVVKYLCGIQVIMTPEEEDHIKKSRRDFSIVVSSRNKSASLFLGPARFANHDCGANAKLMTTGNAGMEIIAVRNIELGEEVTVSYGENYFGEDNCECLCKTCEDNCQNGWTQGDDKNESIPKLSIEQEASGSGSLYSLRRRSNRLDSADDSSRNQSMTPDINIRPRVLRTITRSLSGLKNVESMLGKSPSIEPQISNLKRKRVTESFTEESAFEKEPQSEPESLALKRERLGEMLAPSPSCEQPGTESVVKIEESNIGFSEMASVQPSPTSSTPASRQRSQSTSSADRQTSTDATSVDDDTIVVDARVNASGIPIAKKPRLDKQPNPLEQAESGETIIVGPSTNPEHPAVEEDGSGLSDVGSSIFGGGNFEHLTTKASRCPENSKKRKLIEEDTSNDGEPRKVRKKWGSCRTISSPEPAPARPFRVPGDYVLTPLLLAQPTSAWINCKICEEPFVQENAYFTRSSCPRCERHSKLYGYMWPKTDKEGRDDSEERVLDHRTVHRFIRPQEERMVRKRNRSATESRGVTREVSQASQVKVVDEHKEASDEKQRRSGRKRVKKDRFTL
ncbi:Histone-lysine N-methyltransferase [Venustampulla echinocandica]|uniref:Histone-lysine N-methyltransferase SET9 n=1 Tax=Venustampulla echinocandica TaxID=2656787 RepID=A0A370TRK6_9HELO|nr:Histone-lysine N-methyltransferase [Venustampulla echinocandica]RDL38162.1 Histone-lysine N-methyltransferase [Venustampulla echinocandica]